jgi:tetratricopeptide (TPR) repeat protein
MFGWAVLVLVGAGLLLPLVRGVIQRYYPRAPLLSATSYCQRARGLADTGNFRPALADLARAIELDPRHAEAYWIRGAIYQQQRRYPRAVADFTRALEIKPDLAAAYYWRGRTYKLMGNHEQALADLAQAHALDPGSYPLV